MVKNGSILEINYPRPSHQDGPLIIHPIARFGLVDSRVEKPVRGVKIVGTSGTVLYFEPEDIEKYPVIGFVSVGEKTNSVSGRRFCNCYFTLDSGLKWMVSVKAREKAGEPEITSIVDIRRLAFCSEVTQKFLPDRSPDWLEASPETPRI